MVQSAGLPAQMPGTNDHEPATDAAHFVMTGVATDDTSELLRADPVMTGVATADTSELLREGVVSRQVHTIEHRVSSRIQNAHSNYPSRLRNLNWEHVRESLYVRRHLSSYNDSCFFLLRCERTAIEHSRDLSRCESRLACQQAVLLPRNISAIPVQLSTA